MLATHPPSSSPPYAFSFLPAQPSPLSPRSANIHGPRANHTYMSEKAQDQENDNSNNSAQQQHVPFSKRAVKKAPSPKQDELKERRRNMFLRKVKEGREERRFESRGEDIMRLDFMRRQRAWEAEQARDAPFMPSDLPEDEQENEYDLPTSCNAMQLSQPSTQLSAPEQDVDEFAQMEDQELEALLEYMPVDEVGQEQSQNLWSDDDDYEELFSELMEQEGTAGQGPVQQQAPEAGEGEAMDMS